MNEPSIERIDALNGDIHLFLRNFAFGDISGYMPQVRLFTAIFNELDTLCLIKIQERLTDLIDARKECQDLIVDAIRNSNL